VLLAQAAQHEVDLLVVARVVGARRQVDLAAAAAEVRHGEAQPPRAATSAKASA
jgi:hypothetical protein